MTPLEAAWRSVVERWPIGFREFEQALSGWEIHPVFVDGNAVGAILVNGPEIHACIAGGYGRWFRKEQVAILNAVIERHGYAQTHATTPAGERFVARLGFQKVGNAFRRYTKWESKQS